MSLTLACFIMAIGASAASSIDLNPQDAVTIQDIVEFRDFSGLDVCAGSNLVAARVDRPSISQNGISHDWNIIEWPSGNVRFTDDAGETLNTKGYPEHSFPQWSPDCNWLYYRSLNNGEVQVWRLNGTTGAQEQVTTDKADILNFALTRNGQALVYETSSSRNAILAAERREYENGIRIDEHLQPWARLIETTPVLGRRASYRRWGVHSGGHLLSREPPTYKTMTIRNRKVRAAGESEIAVLTKPNPSWAPQPNTALMASPEGDLTAVVLTKKEVTYGGTILSRLAMARREMPSEICDCSDDRCTAEHLVLLKWSEDGSSVYFIAEEKHGAAGIYEWTPASDTVRTILETDGMLGALASESRSGSCPIIEDIAYCTAAGPENPPHIIAISLTSGLVRTVFDANSEIRTRFALKAKRISWKDNLNRDAVGVLVYPKDFGKGARYPLVITTYTCRGFLSGGIADGGPEYVLAENGFLVLCIDYNNDVPQSLSSKYSYAGARYMAALAEYESAVDMLVEKGLADRHRVGITGLSFGSMASSYALTHSNKLHVAALRGLFVAEPAHEMFNRPSMAHGEGFNKYSGLVGSEEEKCAVYHELSLTMRAERVTAPILVQPSDSEYLGSLPAFAALHKLGKPVEMIVFPDETHMLHQPVHRFVNFTRNLDWFRFWLQGYEDPNPEKAEQYARWRKMRDEQCAQLKDQDDAPWYCRH